MVANDDGICKPCAIEWLSKPAPARRWRPFPIIALFSALTLFCCKAHAELGETPEQMASGKPIRVESIAGGTMMTWKWRDTYQQGFFVNGHAVMEAFWFGDGHKMKDAESTQFLKPYNGYKHGKWQITKEFSYAALMNPITGKTMAMMKYDFANETLSVWEIELFKNLFLEPVQPEYAAPAATPYPKAQPVTTPAPDKNDCMVVATEIFNRVRANSAWAKIIGFGITANGKVQPIGHAMAVWKLTAEGRVYAADQSGTFELHTISTELDDVLKAIAEAFHNKYGEQYTLAGHFSDSPAVNGYGASAATTAATASQSGMSTETIEGLVGMGLGVLVWIFGCVICYLKGKWRVATGAIVSGVIAGWAEGAHWPSAGLLMNISYLLTIAMYVCAIRLPYPWSWWARRFYVKSTKLGVEKKIEKMFARHAPHLSTEYAKFKMQGQQRSDGEPPIDAEFKKI
jgi:hypothetical protein